MAVKIMNADPCNFSSTTAPGGILKATGVVDEDSNSLAGLLERVGGGLSITGVPLSTTVIHNQGWSITFAGIPGGPTQYRLTVTATSSTGVGSSVITIGIM